ncbi:MAG: phosphoenolpyruvate synthase, partial [Gammaproteobacteria bacterium]|nr:phosphoenolpyruvate synthase [Gammaproteobacteria bacterium]
MKENKQQAPLVKWFEELSLEDIPLVGGKNASLGEMYSRLMPLGIPVPNGFAITVDAYHQIIKNLGGWSKIDRILKAISPDDLHSLSDRAREVRELIYGVGIPLEISDQIIAAYRTLQDQYGNRLSLAVRSSATSEDLPTASFAGQHDSYLNIRGDEQLLDACRRSFASIFTDRAIIYRLNNGFEDSKVALSVCVMKMVRSDLASSGVMFTIDTESGFRNVVFITGAYGLGENIVQGIVDPDEFYVHKPTYNLGYRSVLKRVLGDKQVKMVYAETRSGQTTRNIP